MSKITHEGQEYEVLPLDRISEITHAKLAGGIRTANGDEVGIVWIDLRFDTKDARFAFEELADFGIQPLKLLPKRPVEFTREAYAGHSTAFIQLPADCAGKKFKCVEVTE